MFIAVDDTDSRKGMCTTFLATELIREFDECQLLDHPRLVRLNPNVPWKTRGNGAILIEVGKGVERKRKIGEINKDIWTYDGRECDEDEYFKRVEKIIEELAMFDSSKTNPGFVLAKKKPDRELYEKAVRDVVELDEVIEILEEEGYRYRGYGEKRGLIGASAALSWRPEDHTYELLAYRKEEKWGTARDIPEKDVKILDEKIESSFDSYDHVNKKQAIAPNSPCPVLYGVRGDHPKELQEALTLVGGEKPERWLTFLTNQATDDHIQEMSICETKPWTSGRVEGLVSSEPRMIEGGHVLFELEDEREKITAAAYEPTKDFRKVVEGLIEGDEVELWGGIRKEPKTLNIEKMKIKDLKDKIVKVSNPECPECGKNMSSMGKDAGYRCKRCRTKADEDEAVREKVERDMEEKWYEAPVSARRHLSKPLKRIRE